MGMVVASKMGKGMQTIIGLYVGMWEGESIEPLLLLIQATMDAHFPLAATLQGL